MSMRIILLAIENDFFSNKILFLHGNEPNSFSNHVGQQKILIQHLKNLFRNETVLVHVNIHILNCHLDKAACI